VTKNDIRGERVKRWVKVEVMNNWRLVRGRPTECTALVNKSSSINPYICEFYVVIYKNSVPTSHKTVRFL
jgi:hypothetical protein